MGNKFRNLRTKSLGSQRVGMCGQQYRELVFQVGRASLSVLPLSPRRKARLRERERETETERERERERDSNSTHQGMRF